MHKYHPIGTWVEVSRVTHAGVLDYSARPKRREIYERPLKEPLCGQIVGVTRVYGGRRVEGGYEDPAHLADAYAVQVYLVKLAMRGEPIRALPGALTVLSPEGRTLPFQRTWDAPCPRGDYAAREIVVPKPAARRSS